jgi:hypothetical protein
MAHALPNNKDITICIDFTRHSFDEGNGNYEIKAFHLLQAPGLVLENICKNTAARFSPHASSPKLKAES